MTLTNKDLLNEATQSYKEYCEKFYDESKRVKDFIIDAITDICAEMVDKYSDVDENLVTAIVEDAIYGTEDSLVVYD